VINCEGGFADVGLTENVAAEATRLREQQVHLRVVRAVPIGRTR
jgi:hypothetical protein